MLIDRSPSINQQAWLPHCRLTEHSIVPCGAPQAVRVDADRLADALDGKMIGIERVH